jgi:hypothetical protein
MEDKGLTYIGVLHFWLGSRGDPYLSALVVYVKLEGVK